MSPRRLTTPRSWPQQITYLTAPKYSTSFPLEKLRHLRPSEAASRSDEPLLKLCRETCSAVRIIKIEDKSHPAFGQAGLFASKHLPAGSFVLFYLGHVHENSQSDETSNFCLSLDRDLAVSVDAKEMGNEARFTNDYRGIATRPNAEFRIVWADLGNGKHERRMAIFVLCAGKSGVRAKGIAKNEEILVSYGKGFWTERGKDEVETLRS